MQITQIPVQAIQLDINNPRITFATEGITGAVTDQWIELALGKSSPADDEQGAFNNIFQPKGFHSGKRWPDQPNYRSACG